MSGLGIEAEAFLRAFFTGMLLCGIYEALRIFRRLIRHHPLFVSVEDFIYWLFAGFFLFGEIFQTSSGEIRWYFVVGVAVGAVFFLLLLSKTGSSAENFSRKKLENTGKELINLWKQGTIICIIQNHQNVRRGKDEDF